MKKIILALVLIFMVSSVASAVTKYGIGVGYNTLNLPEFNEWGYVPQTEFSLRGIFDTFAVEFTGSYNNVADDNNNVGNITTLGLSLTYLFNFKKDIALEGGIIGTSSTLTDNSIPDGDRWAFTSTNIGLVLGAEYFANENFGINIRLIPLLVTCGKDRWGSEWQNTIMGFATVGAHLYL